jgi:plasmid maintenance system antidote protein VapI
MEMHNPAHPGAALKEWLADMALGTSQEFCYRMQAQWDMAQAKRRFKANVKAIPRSELQSEGP